VLCCVGVAEEQKFFTDAQAFAWVSVGGVFVICCLLPAVFVKYCVCRGSSAKVVGFNAEWGPGGQLVPIPQPDHTQDECVCVCAVPPACTRGTCTAALVVMALCHHEVACPPPAADM